MALNQMQTIQSLGNNLAMLQQEVEIFGVSATETRHLVGRCLTLKLYIWLIE